MLSLAANLFVGVALHQLSKSEQAMVDSIKPSVVTMLASGAELGPGAFISRDGLVITHQLNGARGADRIRLQDGTTANIVYLGKDDPSQLLLYRAEGLKNPPDFIRLADKADGGPGVVYAIFPGGQVRAEMTRGQRVGVDERTRRSVPVSELRIELDANRVGGALLVSGRGRLIGCVAATLASAPQNQAQNVIGQGINPLGPSELDSPKRKPSDPKARGGGQGGDPSRGNALSGGGLGGNSPEALVFTKSYGPGELLVAYTPTWEVTTRAVSGFLSPEHKVTYGTLGLLVQARADRSIAIDQVVAGSPAERAGLMKGDILVSISDQPITSVVDFARVIYRIQPGDLVDVSVRRLGVQMKFSVLAGKQQVASTGGPKSSIRRIAVR